MTRLLNVVMVTATVLGAAPFARAESVLTTAPVARGGVPFDCLIANASQGEVAVKVEAVDINGNADLSSQLTIQPGRASAAGLPANQGSMILYCRFTLLKGSKKKVRAHACAYSSVDFGGPCLSTAEAR